MKSIKNKVTLIGSLTKDPKVKQMGTNKKVAILNIASSETYQNTHGNKIIQTYWHNILIWGNLADLAEQQLKVGTEIAIDGKLINRNYIDNKGVLRCVTQIQANGYIIVGNNKQKETSLSQFKA